MFLVFDIGGTNMRVAISKDGETITEPKIIPTPKDFDQGIQALKQVADEFSQGEEIEAISGGAPVVFDKERSIPIQSAHLKSWVNKPLKKELETIFQVSVKLENDTALEGLGEALFGAGKGKDIVVFLTIGTGVGGVKIVKGRLDTNLLGFEPGHQIIVPDGNLCECGGKGHLETYVAGIYLERIYHKRPEQISDPQIWNQIAKYLAIGVHNIIVHWSPEIIILGGSVSDSIPLRSVATHLNDLMTIFPQTPPILKSTLGKQAGLYGALQLLKQT